MKNLFLSNPARVMAVAAFLLVILVAPFMGTVAHAQPNTVDIDVDRAPDPDIDSIGGVFALIDDVFNILFWLLILLASIFIIWAAFTYLTAGGDPEKVKQANHRVIYAAVAVVVAVLARTIPVVVCSFLGADCSDPDLAVG